MGKQKLSNTFTCSICGKTFAGWGNDPYPVTTGKDDRCCDDCNIKVVWTRINDVFEG